MANSYLNDGRGSDRISYELAEQLDQVSYEILAYLRKNGQIINWDYPIARSGDQLRTFVMMLKPDSLGLKYANCDR